MKQDEAQKTVQDYNHMTPLQWVLRLVQGALVGIGAILPGLSGGVMAVIFGIYRPMMEFLSHPFASFKKYVWLFIPIGLGWAVGFVLFAKLLGEFLGNEATQCIAYWLFIGLIAGTVPSLYKEAGKEGRPGSAWWAFGITTAVSLALLLTFQYTTGATVALDTSAQRIFWFMVCGVMWALSLVAPGMSSSSILMYLGLYQPMSEGIGNLDFQILLPMAAGILIGIFFLARLVDMLFKKHYAVAFHIILGFVISSTLVIIPLQYKGIIEILLCAVAAVIGFFIAVWMEKLSDKLIGK